MATRTHFGMIIVRTDEFTGITTVAASKDCRFRCPACHAECWAVERLRGQTAWLCPRCSEIKHAGREPGPIPFQTQPSRQLAVGERLQSPDGLWTVTKSERIDRFEDGMRDQGAMYVLTRADGHEEKRRGSDMFDFHLIAPPGQTSII